MRCLGNASRTCVRCPTGRRLHALDSPGAPPFDARDRGRVSQRSSLHARQRPAAFPQRLQRAISPASRPPRLFDGWAPVRVLAGVGCRTHRSPPKKEILERCSGFLKGGSCLCGLVRFHAGCLREPTQAECTVALFDLYDHPSMRLSIKHRDTSEPMASTARSTRRLPMRLRRALPPGRQEDRSSAAGINGTKRQLAFDRSSHRSPRSAATHSARAVAARLLHLWNPRITCQILVQS
jgi:hypothetical protein